MSLNTIEEALIDLKNGKMIIVVDDENRENEGDFILPAETVTPEIINFMAIHGRGLICVPLTVKRCKQLGLNHMVDKNTELMETAFTVSVDLKGNGVTSGISASDRAKTILSLVDNMTKPDDLARPGHIFPLVAKDGGVLRRTGHTEAAIDLARLAGFKPAGVVCEIMNEDGTMARMPDLTTFAQYHQLKLGTISDLIAYRRRHDNLVREIKLEMVNSAYGGDWELRTFQDQISGAEHYTLSKGKINKKESILVRMHVFNTFTDVLGIDPKRLNQINDCMLQISEQGTGVLVLLNNRSLEENKSENPPYIIRQYGIGAQILKALGVKKICLLSNSGTPKLIGIEGYGLEISDTIPIKSFKEK